MTEANLQIPYKVRFITFERNVDYGDEEVFSVLDIQEYQLPKNTEERRKLIMKHLRRFRNEANKFWGDDSNRTPRATMVALGKALDTSLEDMSTFSFNVTANYNLEVCYLPEE